MDIIYFDESGNTGTNLNDSQQPVFVLGALVVPEDVWQPLEQSLSAAADAAFGTPRDEDFEVHGVALRNGQGCFHGLAVSDRLAFRDRWLTLAAEHGLKFIYRAIQKSRFKRWVESTFGPGVAINPYVVAFPLVSRVVEEYLESSWERPLARPLGIFVFDENEEVVPDVEKSLRLLRGTESSLRLGRIVEKGFFIDSRKSLLLQLCDVCAFSARKKEERELGLPAKEIDTGGIERLEPLIHRGNEALSDVIAWITEERNKGAARG